MKILGRSRTKWNTGPLNTEHEFGKMYVTRITHIIHSVVFLLKNFKSWAWTILRENLRNWFCSCTACYSNITKFWLANCHLVCESSWVENCMHYTFYVIHKMNNPKGMVRVVLQRRCFLSFFSTRGMPSPRTPSILALLDLCKLFIFLLWQQRVCQKCCLNLTQKRRWQSQRLVRHAAGTRSLESNNRARSPILTDIQFTWLQTKCKSDIF